MEIKKKNILITGGAGFIGSHLVERLYKRHKIVIFDNLRRDSLKYIPELKDHPNVKFIEGDVLDKEGLFLAMKDCDYVVHLAAIAGVSSYYKNPTKTLKVNILGTTNLLECCKELRIKKVIDFSTSEVYGRDAYNVSEDSNHCIGPINDYRWTYAVSKLASEQLTLSYGKKYGFKGFSVRPFNIYGPRQTGEGAISNFFRAVVQKEPIVIYGDGSPIRAWCYISDCIDAIERLVEDETIEEPSTFNIGNPKETCTILWLARLISYVVGYDIPIIFREVERSEILIRIPNIDRAVRVLGYNPKVNLMEGLRLTYEHFKLL
ncbi:MAG: NAD-dependent epimerase/dehydratase family protein [bacterium]